MNEDQKSKLVAATKKYFSRVRSITRKHRGKISGLLHQMDEKHVEAIKKRIEGKT